MFHLITLFILMTLVLLLLLGFILSGVSAFAFGGNFGAMVNSIL